MVCQKGRMEGVHFLADSSCDQTGHVAPLLQVGLQWRALRRVERMLGKEE